MTLMGKTDLRVFDKTQDVALIRDFVEAHHEEEVFVKRRRDRHRTDRKEDGIGDARVRQTADVYRAPSTIKRRVIQ